MKPQEIRIGTTYRIRLIDDLIAEFGMIDGVNRPIIDTPCTLRLDHAEEICGMPFTPKGREEGFFYSRAAVDIRKSITDPKRARSSHTRIPPCGSPSPPKCWSRSISTGSRIGTSTRTPCWISC